MIKQSYSLVMSTNLNPLRNLPKIVQFQFMTTLAFMWSFIFTMWVGSLSVFGPSALAHTLVLIGVFFTAEIFKKAKE
ncbi:hypothetical protein N9423_03650 [Alphaproteobacteria bacterium]|jgi:hypothetical protein|nr:hypothetical protein [Alphaproteobacteria bacterium]